MAENPPISPSHEAPGVSPAASGPAGPLFEGQVGAYYLLSMLAGGEPRGLPGAAFSHIEFQRASDRPLDDVIVHATNGQGGHAVLEIQVKRTIDFTASDIVFRALVEQVAKTAAKPEFRSDPYELAVATERTSTKIERSYQEVLSWARELGTAETFFSRLRQERVANKDMRRFVDNFRNNLKVAGSPHDDAAVWGILRRFQILVFDFNQEGSSTELLVRDRCSMLLAPQEVLKASALWQTLVTLALESAAKGGDKNALQIRETLANEYHYRFGGDRQLANARAALQEASSGALLDISDRVGSIHINRAARLANFYATLDQGRYVEIRGPSGVGKSALLKHIAEQISHEARVVVLSPARTFPHGWLSLRATLGCNVSARDFLSDLASDGGAVLFIDGVDFFEDEGKKITVRDLVRAAASIPNFAVVITARSDFRKDEPSWLPEEALDALGRAPVLLIDALNADEIHQLSEADSGLASILSDKHPAREITRNLFRLARLASGQTGEAQVPKSEALMAQQWWTTGDGGETRRRERTRLVRTLAERSLESSGPFDTRSESPSAVQSLIESATLRELKPEQVIFHHDVLHDWAVGCLLHDEPALIDKLPLSKPAPQTLVRGVEIAARLAIETSTDDTQWARLLDRLSQTGVHGSWRRAALLALVRSEIALPLLDWPRKSLTADKGKLLRELLRVTYAADSEPGSKIYASMGIQLPELPTDFFIPAAPSWVRLILWTHKWIKEIPNEVIPDLADFYSRWSIAMLGQDLITPYLLVHIHGWLVEVESALHPDHFTHLRRPFGLAMSSENERELETSLRVTFLSFSRCAPHLAEQYLRSVAARKPGHPIADEIMKFRGTTAQAAPEALADLTLRALIPVDDDEDFRSSRPDHGPFGVGDMTYFPASPNQGPMLDLLTHAPEEGLRVVRELIDHAVKHYAGDRDPGENKIILKFPEGERTFPWLNCYNWSRGGGHSSIATSTLMALEAWGHKRIENEDAPESVLADILGSGTVPTAFLLVAVDLLISHWPKTQSAAVPFLASPELLSIDLERYVHDLSPHLDPSPKEPIGISSIKSLQNRPSRRTKLDELISVYVNEDSALLLQLRTALSEAAARVGAPGDGDDNMRSVRFAAYHAVNLADPENWKPVKLDRGDGTLVAGMEYQMPPHEEALTSPGRARFAARSTERDMRLLLPLALQDKTKSTPEFLSRALTWGQSVNLSVKDSEEEDIFQPEDWRIQARLTVATLVMRDGDESLRAQHQVWAQQILDEALAAKDDPYRNHPMLSFNPIAIAAVGQIRAVHNAPTEAGLRSLLQIAARTDLAMIPAFTAELATLQKIDPRLPRAIMRIGFASCIHAAHDYHESEEANALRSQARRASVLVLIERELAWLRGVESECEWPVFPNDPPRRRRSRSINRAPEDFEAEHTKPRDSVYSGGAAKWIQSALPLLGDDAMGWFRVLVDAYAEWTSIENGAGRGGEIEANHSSMEWNLTYFDLVARTFVGVAPDEIDRGVLRRVLTFPDEAFFDASAVLIRTLDELYFNAGTIKQEEAVRLRTLLSDELRRRRHWQRVVEHKSTSMEIHLARAVSSLFLHNESWSGGKCYLYPKGSENLKVFLPLLLSISIEAAESQYIAFQFLDLLELKTDPDNLGCLISAATAWIQTYPQDTSFWIEYGMGKRICAWLAEVLKTNPVVFIGPTCPLREIDHLLDGLMRLGVAAARSVEEDFSRVRKDSI
jgi:energy-coupling factor transporter ATP-binding protein EcfA2